MPSIKAFFELRGKYKDVQRLAQSLPIGFLILIIFASLQVLMGCLKFQAEIKPNEPVRVMPERERSKNDVLHF